MKIKWLFLLFAIFETTNCTNHTVLPILSTYINDEGKKVTYTITDFNFTNQLGANFTVKDTYNKVYIANFFFTKCPSICPPMQTELMKISTAFSADDFMITSFTIDPKNDTPEVLKKYSSANGISNDKWLLLNGSEYELSKIATLFKTSFEPIKKGDFYHSSFVALVGKKQQIRGFYNTLQPEAMIALEKDITQLLGE